MNENLGSIVDIAKHLASKSKDRPFIQDYAIIYYRKAVSLLDSVYDNPDFETLTLRRIQIVTDFALLLRDADRIAEYESVLSHGRQQDPENPDIRQLQEDLNIKQAKEASEAVSTDKFIELGDLQTDYELAERRLKAGLDHKAKDQLIALIHKIEGSIENESIRLMDVDDVVKIKRRSVEDLNRLESQSKYGKLAYAEIYQFYALAVLAVFVLAVDLVYSLDPPSYLLDYLILPSLYVVLIAFSLKSYTTFFAAAGRGLQGMIIVYLFSILLFLFVALEAVLCELGQTCAYRNFMPGGNSVDSGIYIIPMLVAGISTPILLLVLDWDSKIRYLTRYAALQGLYFVLLIVSLLEVFDFSGSVLLLSLRVLVPFMNYKILTRPLIKVQRTIEF